MARANSKNDKADDATPANPGRRRFLGATAAAGALGLSAGGLVIGRGDEGPSESLAATSEASMASAGSETAETRTEGHRGAGALLDDRTIRIPTDYHTLQEAIDDLSIRPYKQGVTIALKIEAGHHPASGVTIKHGDFGHFRIESEDAEVALDSSFSGWFINVANARGPVLATLIDAGGRIRANGILLRHASSMHIMNGSGFKNGGVHLLIRQGSFMSANETIWTGAIGGFLSTVVDVNMASTLCCEESDFSGGTARRVMSVREGSRVTGQRSNLDDGVDRCLSVHSRSTGDFRGASMKNSGGDGVYVDNTSVANLRSSFEIRTVVTVVENAARYGILCITGGRCEIEGGKVTGSGREDLAVAGGGVITATNCKTTNGATEPDPQDCNVALNTLTGAGMILVEDSNDFDDTVNADVPI